MNYEDRITKEYVEGLLAGAGPKIAVGTYVGNGEANRTISLSFAPKVVLIFSTIHPCAENVDNDYHYIYGGMMTQNMPIYQDPKLTSSQQNYNTTVAAEITGQGFTVHENYTPVVFSNHNFYSNINEDSLTYCFLALG